MDDGDVEVLRGEMEKKEWKPWGFFKDKIVEDIILPLPIIKDETQHVMWLMSKMLDCEEGCRGRLPKI